MSVEIKLTKLEILDALGIIDNKQYEVLGNVLEHNDELDYKDIKKFLKSLCIAKDEYEVYLDYLDIIDEYILLIKRNEIVDKIKSLSEKDLGNFAEKLVLEIAEDNLNGNTKLLNKIHEILNK